VNRDGARGSSPRRHGHKSKPLAAVQVGSLDARQRSALERRTQSMASARRPYDMTVAFNARSPDPNTSHIPRGSLCR
jgi:hypothetical protein